MRKSILLSFLLLLSSTEIFSQAEMSAFTATGRGGVATTMVRDYQSLGINPALLGLYKTNPDDLSRDKMFSLGIAETAISANSDALTRPDLKKNFFSLTLFQGSPKLSSQEKRDAALAFSQAGVGLNADVMLLGFAFQPKREIGGFAFSVKDRFSSSAIFNETGAGILFNGFNYSPYFDSLAVNGEDTTGFSTNPKNFSQLFQGTRIQINWFREFNLSYGRVIIDSDKMKLYGGIGFKLLKGIGLLDMNVDEGFHAVSALSPVFNINYGSLTTPSAVDGEGAKSVGSGFGLDAGLVMTFGNQEEFKVGLSVTDIGSMTWNGNVYTANDTILQGVNDHGFDSYNFITEAQDIVGDSGMFSWGGSQSYKVALPGKIRIGGSYRINNYVEVSSDLVLPLNAASGNFTGGIFAAGVDLKLPKVFTFSTGMNISNNFGFNIPLGIYLRSGKNSYEMGIASRDAITFFSRNTPVLSLAMGMFRFHF